MTEAPVRYATTDGVATITFDRPDALNALTPEMLVRLGDLLEQAATDDGRAWSCSPARGGRSAPAST